MLALTAAGDGEDAETRAATATIAAQSATSFLRSTSACPTCTWPARWPRRCWWPRSRAPTRHAFGGATSKPTCGRSWRPAAPTPAGSPTRAPARTPATASARRSAVLALLRTTGGVPGRCGDASCWPSSARTAASGCSTTPARPARPTADDDPDATGLAVQALSALTPSAAVTAAQAKAVAWLKGAQNATTGSFSGSGPTATVPNSNSTGLAAVALRLGGETAAADQAPDLRREPAARRAARTPGPSATTPPPRPPRHGGTIAHRSDLDQWRRATAQAMLALGVPSYGQIVAVPTAPTSSTSSSSQLVQRSSLLDQLGVAARPAPAVTAPTRARRGLRPRASRSRTRPTRRIPVRSRRPAACRPTWCCFAAASCWPWASSSPWLRPTGRPSTGEAPAATPGCPPQHSCSVRRSWSPRPPRRRPGPAATARRPRASPSSSTSRPSAVASRRVAIRAPRLRRPGVHALAGRGLRPGGHGRPIPAHSSAASTTSPPKLTSTASTRRRRRRTGPTGTRPTAAGWTYSTQGRRERTRSMSGGFEGWRFTGNGPAPHRTSRPTGRRRW